MRYKREKKAIIQTHKTTLQNMHIQKEKEFKASEKRVYISFSLWSLYIYIYKERERERERGGKGREKERNR